MAQPNHVPQGRFGLLDSRGFQFPDLIPMQEDRIRARAPNPHPYEQVYPYSTSELDHKVYRSAVEGKALPELESQPASFRRSFITCEAEASARETYERELSGQSLDMLDRTKTPIIKREHAVDDIHKILTGEPDVNVMIREIGGLLEHFTKRDGSPLTVRDLSILTHDMNSLLARHIESPHEIHEHAKHAFEHAKHGLQKVGNFFKKNWEKVVDVATSALSFTPVGLALKAAEGIEKGAMAIKSAVTGAKAARKGDEAHDHVEDAKNHKDQHDEKKAEAKPDPKAAKKPGKRDANVSAESLAITIADALNTVQARGLSGPINTLINRHEIVVRDPKVLRERLVHLLRRGLMTLAGARASSGQNQHLTERSLDSNSNTTGVLFQRDANGAVTGFSEVHMQVLAPHLIDHMHQKS